MSPASNSVLLITLSPDLGGMTYQSALAIDALQRAGYDLTVAWRAHFSADPDLSVPAWKLGRARPSLRELSGRHGPLGAAPRRRVAVGSWLPELEWMHHQPWTPWRELIEGCRRHVVVSGNNLPGWGVLQMGLPSVHWIATTHATDRIDRFKSWSAPRRAFDVAFNGWMCARQERAIVEQAETYPISAYTQRTLAALSPRAKVREVLPIPVDAERFAPQGRRAAGGQPLVVGFCGRVSDPRKNIGLLVGAFERVVARNADVELHVVGDMAREAFVERYGAQRIADRLKVFPPAPASDLPAVYRGFDVFAIPSHQEGLSIVGVEAMASGCTVVSTRCGGPQDFVLDGETGVLSGFAVEEYADALERGLADAGSNGRLAAGGVALVRERYAQARFESTFVEAVARLPG